MTSLFRVSGNELVPIGRGTLAAEKNLEDWIVNDPRLVGVDILTIGRQVTTESGGRIDILGIDSEGDLVIVELKRNRTPREVVAQVLDYGSWIVSLNTKEVYELASRWLSVDFRKAFIERFGGPLPDVLNGNHSMVIVATELDPSSKRIIEYLAEHHGVSINTVFFSVFEEAGQTLIATDWLMDQAQVEERSQAKSKAPWLGDWYANVGDDWPRSWEDMRTYGFLSAGGGRTYSGPLDKLAIGDPVFAYQKQAGYVGYGTTTSSSVMAKDFAVGGVPLLEMNLAQPRLAHDKDDPERSEYVVGIKWHKTYPISEAKTFPGAFANQNVVCKLRDAATLEFLYKTFKG
jgi:hypothetical protein